MRSIGRPYWRHVATLVGFGVSLRCLSGHGWVPRAPIGVAGEFIGGAQAAEQRCVVIGLFPLGNWSNMNRLEGTHKAAMKSTTGTERLRFKGLLEQGRFDLGKATFPEAEERVNQVCDAIRTAGGSAHCDEPIPPSRIAIPPS